ncbi:putative permease [Methylophaga frappieri]|uniref:Probable membrane transporter protein n=1 Tax=Methylophaga frappieri (strain ATCC BAA-2434 / DSM 25690 / JAM7) TaxID=754477 RepID=I1YIP0_METFJ|nr:sulfite exporter TauE/SafE family protein [Methylophaga frappieri]AFJ02783.1 putative permease [Methylophaga frappieri]
MTLFEHCILFVVSLLANTFSALSGGGAGLIQFPVLIFLGLSFAVALATHKVASVALGLGAILRYLRTSRLERQFVSLLLVAGLPGVVLGGNLILQVPDRLAEVALGVLTGSLGIYSFLTPDLGQDYQPKRRDVRGFAWGGGALFFLGVLNGSLTSGTGLFVTLWLVLWFGMDYQRAVAYTLILVGLFWNGAGAITLGILGDIRWDWLPALLFGSLIGGYLGSHLALRWGNRWIKRCFEIVTLLIGIRLITGPI